MNKYENLDSSSEGSSRGNSLLGDCALSCTTEQLNELKIHLMGLLVQSIKRGVADEQAEIVKKLELAISFESHFSDIIVNEYESRSNTEEKEAYVAPESIPSHTNYGIVADEDEDEDEDTHEAERIAMYTYYAYGDPDNNAYIYGGDGDDETDDDEAPQERDEVRSVSTWGHDIQI